MIQKIKFYLFKVLLKSAIKELDTMDLRPMIEKVVDAVKNTKNPKAMPHVQLLLNTFHKLNPGTQKEMNEAFDALSEELLDKVRDKIVDEVNERL